MDTTAKSTIQTSNRLAPSFGPIVWPLLVGLAFPLLAQNTPSDGDRNIRTTVTFQNRHQTTYRVIKQGPLGEPELSEIHEVANGLNFKDQTGNWIRANPSFQSTDTGQFIAPSAGHKVYLRGVIPTEGNADLVEMTTEDGITLRSTPTGIGYFDPETGQSITLATILPTQGRSGESNIVTYPHAFSGLDASVRFKNNPGSFHQEILLHEQPPDPEELGLSSRTRLEVYTAFTDGLDSAAIKEETFEETLDKIQAPNGLRISTTDLQIKIGTATDFDRGWAFQDKGNPSERIRVSKALLKDTSGRTILVESVPYAHAKTFLKELPDAMYTHPPDVKHQEVRSRKIPKSNARENTTREVATTQSSRHKAFVMDYDTISGWPSTFTFVEDQTYYIPSPVDVGYAYFQRNATIKFGPTAYLRITGQCFSQGTSQSPTILTSRDENMFGETIANSSGNPSTYYASPAIALYYCAQSTVSYFWIRNASVGINLSGPSVSTTHTVSNVRLDRCTTGISVTSSGATLNNVTSCNVSTPLSNNGGSVSGSVTANCNGDTDSDGLLDSAEPQPLTTRQGWQDTDGDGYNDYVEQYFGTSPIQQTSKPTLSIADSNNANNPPVTSWPGIRNDYAAFLTAPAPNNVLANFRKKWSMTGQYIKTYFHDVDEVNNGPGRQHLLVSLLPNEHTQEAISFFWRTPSPSAGVTFRACNNNVCISRFNNIAVNHPTDPSQDIYTYITGSTATLAERNDVANISTSDPRRSPNGSLTDKFRLLLAHARWHHWQAQEGQISFGGVMDDGENPYPHSAAGIDPEGDENYWGDTWTGTIAHNGSSFLQWHRALLDAHITWRTAFNVPVIGALPSGSTGFGAYNERYLHIPQYLKRFPTPIPPLPPSSSNPLNSQVSAVYQYVRLGEFQTLDQLGIDNEAYRWHGLGHTVLKEFDTSPGPRIPSLVSPGASDDLFWKWHTQVDVPRQDWVVGGPDQAVVTSHTPAANATVPGPVTSIYLVFDMKVSAGRRSNPAATIFDVLPPAHNLVALRANKVKVTGTGITSQFGTVIHENGDPNGINDSTFMKFRITGFTPAQSGVVTVELTGTAGYAGKTWTFTVTQ